MTGFLTQISSNGSLRSDNWATSTTLVIILLRQQSPNTWGRQAGWQYDATLRDAMWRKVTQRDAAWRTWCLMSEQSKIVF